MEISCIYSYNQSDCIQMQKRIHCQLKKLSLNCVKIIHQQQSSTHNLTPVVSTIVSSMVPSWPVSIGSIVQPSISIGFAFWLSFGASLADVVTVVSISMVP